MVGLRYIGIPLALLVGCSAGAESVEPGAFTIVVLPDTQIYARSYPEIFEAETQWIVDNRDVRNIEFVLHPGDLVDDNSDAQWTNASNAMHLLDGEVPYVFAPGNHDMGAGGSASDRATLLHDYFSSAEFEAMPSFVDAFELGRLENTAHRFETALGTFLVLALEFGPRDPVIDWAREVLTEYADLRTIIMTHAYLYSDDTRYDHGTREDQHWSPYSYGVADQPGGVNDGEEMWTALVEPFAQVELVLCGHVLNDGLGRLTSTRSGGEAVHQVLANYQERLNGGNGFLRLLEFSPEGSEIRVRTYSPYLGEYWTDTDNEFTLTRSVD